MILAGKASPQALEKFMEPEQYNSFGNDRISCFWDKSLRMKSSEKGRNSRKIQFSKESFSHKGCLNALFGWIQISYEFWLPVQYALELSSISRHFYGMGSASKMEITFFIQFILAPRIFLKIGSGLSEGVHTNTTIFTSSIKIGTEYF